MNERTKNIFSAALAIMLTVFLLGGVVYLLSLIKKEVAFLPKKPEILPEEEKKGDQKILASLAVNSEESIYILKDGYKILLSRKAENNGENDSFFESSEIEDFVSEYSNFPAVSEITLKKNKDSDVFIVMFGDSKGAVPYVSKIVYKINFKERNIEKIYEMSYSSGNLKEGIPAEFLIFTFESSALLKDDIALDCEAVIFNSSSGISLNKCDGYKIKGYTERIIAAEEYGPAYLQPKKYIYHDSEGKEMAESRFELMEENIYLKLETDGLYKESKDGKIINKFII